MHILSEASVAVASQGVDLFFADWTGVEIFGLLGQTSAVE